MSTIVHPTLLSRLVREGRWTIEETCTAFERTAREMGEDATLSIRQLRRWMDGRVGRPRPVARRVAEKFWGCPFDELLGPAQERPQPDRLDGAASGPHPRSASTTRLGYVETHDRVASELPVSLPVPSPSVPGGRSVTGRPETDDMDRRDLLRLITMTAAALAAPVDWERMERALTGGGRLDAEAVEEFATLHSHQWRVFALSASKASVLPAVRSQIAVLVDSLGHPQSPEVRQRLGILVADLYQLAGEIYFDGNHYTKAAQCSTLAATASKEAEEFDLWACALTRHAFISVYGRRYEDASPMLALAAGLANRGDRTLSTRHWVAAVQAETFAGLGRFDLCERALDLAEEIRNLPDPVHNGGWLRFDGSRLAEERGTCYVALGRTDLAEAALTTALAQLRSSRRRSGVLVDLALIGVQRRDVDMLVTHAEAAMDLAQQTGSGVIAQRLLWLRAQLPRHSDPRVHQLSHRIAAVAGASAAS